MAVLLGVKVTVGVAQGATIVGVGVAVTVAIS